MILQGNVLDVLPTLPDQSVQCCVTSPPYFGLRQYLPDGHSDKGKELGLEPTPDAYVASMVAVFREVRRVLKDDGVLFLNLADSYYAGRVQSNGTSCKVKQDYQYHDSFFGNPGDGHKDLWWHHISDTGARLVHEQVYVSCVKILSCMEELIGHLPTVDSRDREQIQQSVDAILGLKQTVAPAIERLLAFPVSMNAEFSPQLRSGKTRDGIFSAFLLSLGTFCDDVLPSVRMLGESIENAHYNQGISSPCGELLRRIRYTYESCLLVSSWLNHPYLFIKPQRSNIQLKHKDLIGIPWRVAFALQADGWYLRQDIIWHKPNPMPESVKDRCTKAHEYIFLLSKQPKYYYDWEAIAEPLAESSIKRYQHAVNTNEQFDPTRHKSADGIQSPMEVMTRTAAGALSRGKKNKRTVWTIPTQNYAEAHFATFPEKLPMYCVLAGSKPGDTVLDPFSGSATTGIVAQHFGRSYIGIELNPEYVVLSEKRLAEGSRYLEREYPQQTTDTEAFPALD